MRKLSYKETRELETIEADILAAEEKVASFEAELATADFYAKHGHDWPAMEKTLKEDTARVTLLYARWEELEAIRAASA